MTEIEKHIYLDRLKTASTYIQVFITDYAEEIGIEPEKILLSKKADSLLSELKDKIV